MFDGISLGDKAKILANKKEPTSIVGDYTNEIFDGYAWCLFGIAAIVECLLIM